MIEMVLTVSMTAMVVGVVAMMYSFVAVRLSDSYIQSLVCDQANDVADRIEATVRNADSCTVLDSGTTLMCTMPLNGVDVDKDGHYDLYYPDTVDSSGNGVYSAGRYYWFFNAGINGNYNSATSGFIWRADSTSSSVPQKTQNDLAFMYFPGGVKMRNPLVYQVKYTVNATAKNVTFAVTAGSRIGSENTDTSDQNASRIVTITRTVHWRD